MATTLKIAFKYDLDKNDIKLILKKKKRKKKKGNFYNVFLESKIVIFIY